MSPHLQGLLIALAIGAVVVAGYAADHPVQRSNSTMHTDGPVPNAASFTSAPLRNRIRVELKAPVPNVWALMGDLTRYPEYSSGLERVEVKKIRAECSPSTYAALSHKRKAERVFCTASSCVGTSRTAATPQSPREPNAFGLTNSLTLVTLGPSKEGAIMTWEQYYDAADLDMNKAVFDQALADIAERLIARFGGRVVERYVDGPL